MKKLNNMLISTQLKASAKAEELKEKFVAKENGDTQVVVALILIVVAVGLCILFQDEIADIIASVVGEVDAAITNLTTAGE